MDKFSPKLKHSLLLSTYIIILSFIFLNLKEVLHVVTKGLDILTPFTLAIGIAFVLNIPMKLFENKLFSFLDAPKAKKFSSLKRPLSILTTFLLVIFLVVGFILFVIPQLAQSISTLTNAIPDYLKSLENLMNEYIHSSNLLNLINNDIMLAWKDFLKLGTQVLGTSLSGLLNMTLGVTSGIVDFTLAIVLAIYMLASKEKLILQIKKVLFAFLNSKLATKWIEIGALANVTFYRFIAGQFTEALIIGVLCFIGMSVFQMPYALLISVIVSVTSLIPVFGAFIGTIPGVFIIFIIDPIKALWFIVFIIVLQQIEGNLIYPRVVGNSIGLSAIWVMLAMVVGGSTFGILGMLLGIPLFSIIYQLLRETVHQKLKVKKLL